MSLHKIIFLTTVVLFSILLSCSTTKKNSYSHKLNEFRNEYKQSFLLDERSPLTKEDLKFLDFFSADEHWNLTCTCDLKNESQPFDMATYSGMKKPYKVYAVASCKRLNDTIQLYLYQSVQKMNPLANSYLFLPFKDLTNSATTYGGGRYINLKTDNIQNGFINIDFNKAYNPWCAYSEGYNCPIPPVENHLKTEVLAGEKDYLGPTKKSKK